MIRDGRIRLAGCILAVVGVASCLMATTFWGTMTGFGVYLVGLISALWAHDRIREYRRIRYGWAGKV